MSFVMATWQTLCRYDAKNIGQEGSCFTQMKEMYVKYTFKLSGTIVNCPTLYILPYFMLLGNLRIRYLRNDVIM